MVDLARGPDEITLAAGGLPERDPTTPPAGTPQARAAGWRSLRFWLRRPGLVLSILIVVVVVLWSLVPGVFTSTDPNAVAPDDSLQGPSASHPFGTDDTGRDIYARVIYGAESSLLAASLGVGVALVGGSILGLVAGYRGGRVDDLLMRVVDVLYAIPAMLLALTVVTALGFGTVNIGLAVGIVGIAAFTRLMRSEVLRVRTMPYVEAAQASGVRAPTVIVRHVLPNSWGPVLVLATLEFGVMLLAISALSFLGFGTPPPAPEWGSMVAEGRAYLTTAWWMTTFPGLVLAAVVLSVNRISRASEGETR